MSKAFSNTEREKVRTKLKEAALACLDKYGIKKSSVDQLVKLAGISKGSFYSFYPSKEIFLFEVITEYHDAIQQFTIEQIYLLPAVPNYRDFAEVLYRSYKQMDGSFLMRLMSDGEMEYLMRKLPEDVIKNHHLHDDEALNLILSIIPFSSPKLIPEFSAGLRAIFLTLTHKREIGLEHYDKVLMNLLISFCKYYIPTQHD